MVGYRQLTKNPIAIPQLNDQNNKICD